MAESGGRRLDVLLVEDDELVARAIARALRVEYDVRLATGLFEALEEVESRPPDVLITDFHLPPYFGGQLLAVTGRDYPRVARIAYSGRAGVDLQHLVELGLAERVVEKIHAREELLEAVREVVEEHRRRESS